MSFETSAGDPSMILVTGATGTVGGAVVAALRDAGMPVRALRRAGSAGTFPAGVDVAVGDLGRPEALRDALTEVSALFLLAGVGDVPATLEQAARAGVERVALLSTGAVVGGEASNAITRFNLDSEQAVRDSGLGWTVLRASGFTSNALRWLPQLNAGDVVRGPFAEVAVAAIDPADIGAVAAKVLAEPGHEGRAYRLTGPEPLRPADEVEILAQVLDRPLRFEAQSDEQARAEMSESTPQPYVDAFFRYFADGTYDDSKVLPTVADLLGRPARTFRAWAIAHADDFR